MPRARPTAVIFDLDGVLVDSEPLWHEAEIAAFAAVGLALTPTDCLRTTGLRVDAVAAFWAAERGFAGHPADVAADVVARMAGLLRSRAVPLPGAVAAVQLAAEHGPVALASSSPSVLIDAALTRLGIRDRFVAVCSAEDEPYGKPHPAVYQRAIRALAMPPAACLAIEDSANGIRAAHAAGARVLAVPDQPVSADALALAEDVLPSLLGFSPWWAALGD